ncbi:MAG: DUF6439 family protein [Gloeomargarita sp. SKYG116]|nr:DUF6439 family protein [Gloeomargarita sp. SKYG116]MCS7292752.1 DUF6439 family protein [Gloeomargarita sp. SKYB120]MDW8178315.1 DUF6439 family protein [Gloeomargarita sp. SKYBB_i_bin120]MDW8401004.1 DUF6439 family protein [Gloeomargarita sp. SKYGB_i_bin116]
MDAETRQLVQALCDRLRITPEQWHRLKNNRKARAAEQLAAALSYLLHDQPEQALHHTRQAQGWLDRSVQPLPCPEHSRQ